MSRNRERTRLRALPEKGVMHEKETLATQMEAQSRLRKSGYPELHLVSCEFHGGVLTLRGRVSTFYLKQVAQTLIRGLDGVGAVNNRLDVDARQDSNL